MSKTPQFESTLITSITQLSPDKSETTLGFTPGHPDANKLNAIRLYRLIAKAVKHINQHVWLNFHLVHTQSDETIEIGRYKFEFSAIQDDTDILSTFPTLIVDQDHP